MSDASFWENHYQANDTPWDKGEPSPGLVDFLSSRRIAGGSVCVPGCGMGHDVRAWAAKGMRAVGLDIAPSAVERAAENARRDGVAVEFRHGDFLKDEPTERFDWIFEHTCFCAIQPEWRTAYVNAVHEWLKPGGHYLAVNYLLREEGGPPFTTSRGELVERLGGRFQLLEEWVPRSYPNRVGLELMLLWRKRG